MTYIENVFICMASPLLIAALCMGRRQAKFFLCCLAGMGACLLSAYINTFFAALYAADTIAATAEIAPVVEEVMKLLPLLFYLLVFEPEPVPIKNAAIIVALSFATFENVCYLIQNGAGHFSFIYFSADSPENFRIYCCQCNVSKRKRGNSFRNLLFFILQERLIISSYGHRNGS